MRNLIKITGLTTTACLLGLTSDLVLAQGATTLSGLLDLVENDRVAESAEYVQRQQEFEQNANRQQSNCSNQHHRQQRCQHHLTQQIPR